MTERVTGLGRRTREEIAKWNKMTALRFQTGRRHQTSPASLRRGGDRDRTETQQRTLRGQRTQTKTQIGQKHNREHLEDREHRQRHKQDRNTTENTQRTLDSSNDLVRQQKTLNPK